MTLRYSKEEADQLIQRLAVARGVPVEVPDVPLVVKAARTPKKRDISTAPPDIEGALAVDLMQAGLGGFERNYRFDLPRRWELDFAWPMARVAIEVQGGLHSYGAHVRPAGYKRDAAKSRRAQLMGWILLPCTAADLKDKSIIADVETALEIRRPGG